MRTKQSLLARRVVSVLAVGLLHSAESSAVPAAPSLSPAQVVGNTVTLSWTLPFGTTAIRLEAGTAPGLSNAANTVVGAIAGYTATDVPNGAYYVRVRAIDGSGESAPSNEVTVIIGGGSQPSCSTPPAPPTLGNPAVNGNNVAFTWTSANVGCPATAFALHAGSGPGQSNLAIVNLGSILSFSATAPNGTYFVRVVAQNSYGVSLPSNEIIVTVGSSPSPLPPTPTSPTPPSSLTGLWSGQFLVPGVPPVYTFEFTQSGARLVGVQRGAAPGMTISFDLTQVSPTQFTGTLTFEQRAACPLQGSLSISPTNSTQLSGRFTRSAGNGCNVDAASVTLSRLP